MLKIIKQRRDQLNDPNEYRILRLVRDAREISRMDLARITQLSKTTVSEIVNRFIQSGFIRSGGSGPSTTKGGRKGELLTFDPDAAFVIGVDVELDYADVAVTNLDARIMERVRLPHPRSAPPGDVLPAIAEAIHAFGRTKPKLLKKAVGIGIGVPGIVDQTAGVLRETDTRASWEGVNIGALLQKQFHIPIFVENDVKARMLGELIFGTARNVHDAVYLWIGSGIGAGIVIDGKLHHGATSSAGEVGFTLLSSIVKDRRAFPMLYDRQRKLGDIISNTNIIRAFTHAKGLKRASIQDVVTGDAANDMISVQIMDEVAELVGFLCVNLVNTINPDLIILGGELFHQGEKLKKRIEAKIRTDILSVPAQAVRVEHAGLKEDGVLLGSVGHVLYDLFKPSRESSGFAPGQS